jgi:hypothetical protein
MVFRDLIADRLAFVSDNHFALWMNGEGGERDLHSLGGRVTAYVADDARFIRVGDAFVLEDTDEPLHLLDCRGRSPNELLRPTIHAARPLPRLALVPIVLSAEPVETLECVLARANGARVTRALALEPMADAGVAGPAFERREAPFPWLAVRSLAASHAAALERFVSSADALRDAPVVVLDLRGGGGGSDLYLVRFFQGLTSQTLDYFVFDELESEVVLAGALSFWRCVRESDGADVGGRAWLDARVSRAERELDEAMRTRGVFRELVRHTPHNRGRAPRPFAGRLVVLTDGACASACETGVMLARQIPGTIVVGENTNGTLKVGEIRWYELPRSQIFVSLGSRVHRDPRSHEPFPEALGYVPDLWLEGDARYDEAVGALARCLEDGACAAALDAELGR